MPLSIESSSVRNPVEMDGLPNFVDLRHKEDDAARTQYLLRREELLRIEKRIDNLIYVVHGDIHETLKRMAKLKEAVWDIDGTLTGIGDKELYPDNIDGLHKLAATGMEQTALTGRHYGQVADLWRNHPEGTAINTWMSEQGFYTTQTNGNREFFTGNEALESMVATVRSKLQPLIPEMETKFNIRFRQTSAEGYDQPHTSMYSVDAHNPDTGLKIDETQKGLHEELLHHFKMQWLAQDPDGDLAKTGTSSIGTYEWTVDGINKERSLQQYMRHKNRAAQHIGVIGDSGNDEVVFGSKNDYLKMVVVNDHTKEKLIRHARIATVGRGNASPLMEVMERMKHLG